ncbi:MAG: RagB/SusD family nutrient uptake outer membrane protein [Candidatus Nephrothrix sp. EaCA]|nr:MAG: RagB/SusD family nutrient uptake outer membrane protein [Candidatus Nephrothrix sp. EaCA]
MALSSCEKTLEKKSLSQFSNDNFWKSESDAFLALTAIYRGTIRQLQAANADAEFSNSDWWSYHGFIYLDLASDLMYDRRGDTDMNRIGNGNLISTNGYVNNYWSNAYLRIARCNFFLENIDKVSGDAKNINRMRAEARFIRAVMYFYLSQYWQDVPLVTAALTAEQANTIKKSPKKEIVDFAAAELNACALELPRQNALSATERGRASSQAALAFLGRLLLAEKRYAEAAAAYKKIIDMGENIIDPVYKSLFNGANEASKEIIFAVQFQENLLTNGLLLQSSIAVIGGYHLCNPLANLAEEYEFTDGSPFSYSSKKYNPANIGANRDPRLFYSIFYNQELVTESPIAGAKYISHPDSSRSLDQLTLTKQATRSGYGLRKFMPPTLPVFLPNTGIDLIVIRYAEVLLSYLEAKLENGDAIDQTLLDQTINAVRGRADVRMPKILFAGIPDLRAKVRHERKIEFAFEGFRLWDLLRWGIAAEVLNGDFYGASFPKAKNLRRNNAKKADPFSRWYVTTKTFRKGIDDKWPIPQREQDINPNLR